MKTSIAQHLVERYTTPDEVVLDPFCGSGVVPLEAALAGRRVVGGDLSPYGVTLTRGKLGAPVREERAQDNLRRFWSVAVAHRSRQDLRRVPKWVREFFHPETLRDALALRDELVARKDWFLLSCLLGILHHQRPGFLSYPSSHLVPYLRSRLFPRDEFPNMYERRDVASRMEAKVRRAYRRPNAPHATWRVHLCEASRIPLPSERFSVITSPPYMNELDYVRDNRLRLWFLLRDLPPQPDIRKKDRRSSFSRMMTHVLTRIGPRMHKRSSISLVAGDSRRGTRSIDAAEVLLEIFASNPELKRFSPVEIIEDTIPDIRRSRRDLRGTKRETILVFRKS